MTVAERLVAIRKSHGYTRRRLAQELGRPYTTIANYESGEREPGHSYLIEIARKFGVSTDYILGVPETSSKNSSYTIEALQIAKSYDALDSYGKNIVRLIIAEEKRRIQECHSTAQNNPSKIVPLRLSEQPAAAGTGTYLGPECFETIYVKEDELVRRAAYAVPVTGDSMEPTYYDGDILLVSSESPEIGDIGIFTLDGQGYVKRLGDGVLISINPKYDPIPMGDTIRCNGKVIGVLDADALYKD